MDIYTRISLNLFSYRNLPTAIRVKIFLFETSSAIHFFENATRQLDYYKGDSTSETPVNFLALAEKISAVGKSFGHLFENIESQENVIDKINTYTGNLLEQMVSIISEFAQEDSDSQNENLELDIFVANVNSNIQLIQATAHTLFEQKSSLPDQLTEWAMNRHEIKQRAKNVDQTILPELYKTLKNPEPSIRQAAINLFQFFDSSIDLAPLISLLDDPSEEVRQATAKVLGDLGSQQAVTPLVNTLDSIGFPAAAALFKLGEPQSRTYLLQLLEQEDFSLKHATLKLFLDDLKLLWNKDHVPHAESSSDIAHNQELAQQIIDQLKKFEPYFAPYSYMLCNELRHYSGTISERKAMEYVNIILENNVMDRYIIHILSDWFLAPQYEWFDQEKGIQALLTKAQTYSDLFFLEIACLLETANTLSSQGDTERARKLFLEILDRSGSENMKSLLNYQRLAWMRLKILDDGRS
ncbi:MAG: HEAT repeat domain-containing protein [Ardenticatenaceae bacterium]|nr:HEAT repeat domain-containing protein [Ardenticatenaceae bacterium]